MSSQLDPMIQVFACFMSFYNILHIQLLVYVLPVLNNKSYQTLKLVLESVCICYRVLVI